MPDGQKTSSRAGIEGHAASRAAGQDVRQDEQTAYAERIGLSSALKTVFLCHYLRRESLRGEIHEGLQLIDT
jgi:TnpA family transposase